MSRENSIDKEILQTRLPGIRPEARAAITAYVDRLAAEYANQVLSITLYGSQAREEADPESDIDLLVVVRHDTPALRQALIDLAWHVQFDHDVVISDMIRNAAQLKQMQASQFPYYQNITREGI